MSSGWKQTSTWVGAVAVAICLALAGLAGLWEYMSRTAVVLYRDREQVPSATVAAAAPRWRGAAAESGRLVREAVSAGNLAGISVAVGVDGATVWAEGFGWADTERRIGVTPDTRFRIGTASIALTSAAVGALIERSRLRLDDDIRTHVPAWPEARGPVTLRQVMGHVAGLVSDGGDEGPLLAQHCDHPAEALATFADRRLRFEPGTQFEVSNYGWILVSAAIESAAAEPFMRVMSKQVFEPLGMHDTGADLGGGSRPDRATSYFPRFAADPRYGLDLTREVDYSCYAGASGFETTPSDLVRFGVAMIRGTLLEAATVESLQTAQRLPSGEATGYGLGWAIKTVTLNGTPARAAGHDGELLGGMVASLLTFREQGLVVAVTSNTSFADTATLATRIAQVFAAASGVTPAPAAAAAPRRATPLGDRGPALPVAGGLLEGVRELQHAPLVAMTANDLQPHRQP